VAGVGGSGVRFERSEWLLEAEVSCGFLGDCFRCRVDEVAFLLDDVGDDGPGVDVGFVGVAKSSSPSGMAMARRVFVLAA
jgi:hypothetical protein